jgi:hypothetical protein
MSREVGKRFSFELVVVDSRSERRLAGTIAFISSRPNSPSLASPSSTSPDISARLEDASFAARFSRVNLCSNTELTPPMPAAW